MVIPAIKYEFRRLMGKMTRLDPRRSIPRNLQIGPLTYGQWNEIMDGIFTACRLNSTIVLSYKIETLDELLTFNRDKAIARGMITDYSKVTSYEKLLPKIEGRWSPLIELIPMLNRKAAEHLKLEKGKPWEALSKFTGLYTALRCLEAQSRQNEPIVKSDIDYINKLGQALAVDFTLAS
jgi:hypothetical protein